VTLSLRDSTYMTAVKRMAAVAPDGEAAQMPEPFFNPFGASRENRHGWRTAKYPSNGPPDTVNGPSWNPIIEVISHGPRVVKLREDYLDHLPSVVITGDGPYPGVLDAAEWFFRFDDLETSLGPSVDESALIQAFETQVGLTSSERTVIYGPTT
jgi:hypothetical protein